MKIVFLFWIISFTKQLPKYKEYRSVFRTTDTNFERLKHPEHEKLKCKKYEYV